MSSEKPRRQNLIFIYESREAQTDLDRCLLLRLSTTETLLTDVVLIFIPFRASLQVMIGLFPLHVKKVGMFLINNDQGFLPFFFVNPNNTDHMQGFFQPIWEGALGPFALGNFRHFNRNWEIFFIHFYSIFLNRDAYTALNHSYF